MNTYDKWNVRFLWIALLVAFVVLRAQMRDGTDQGETRVVGSNAASAPRLGDPEWAGWVSVPAGFRRVQADGHDSHTTVTSTDVLDGRYEVSVGVGRFTDWLGHTSRFFALSVMRPVDSRWWREVGRLRVPLELVDESRLRAKAADVVSLDPVTRVLSFDLGKSVFKFQLPVENEETGADS